MNIQEANMLDAWINECVTAGANEEIGSLAETTIDDTNYIVSKRDNNSYDVFVDEDTLPFLSIINNQRMWL